MRVREHARRLKPERLIAAGRVVLAVCSLFAVWLDPTEPVKSVHVAYGLLVAYVVYAGAVAAVVSRVETLSRWWPAVTHAVDLVFFSLFIVFTAGVGSPFTVYFVFALICGTLRWQARGTVWTAAVTLTIFTAFGIYFGLVLHDPAFDLRAFIIRGVYLFVLAVLLGYVGLHEQHMLREMWLLASWPHAVHADLETLVRNLLGYGEPLVGAPHAVLAWSEHDAPRRLVASWHRGQWSCQRQSSDTELVAKHVADRAFICVDLPAGRTLIQTDTKSLDLVPWVGEALDRDFAQRVASRTVLSVPIAGESFSGRLFLLDKVGYHARRSHDRGDHGRRHRVQAGRLLSERAIASCRCHGGTYSSGARSPRRGAAVLYRYRLETRGGAHADDQRPADRRRGSRACATRCSPPSNATSGSSFRT